MAFLASLSSVAALKEQFAFIAALLDVAPFLEPVFQFWLVEIFKDMELNRSLYTVGLKLGVRFKSSQE